MAFVTPCRRDGGAGGCGADQYLRGLDTAKLEKAVKMIFREIASICKKAPGGRS